MRRESHVRFCEGLRGRFPRATRLEAGEFSRLACRKSPKTVIGNVIIMY
jgi:hypothetical protein